MAAQQPAIGTRRLPGAAPSGQGADDGQDRRHRLQLVQLRRRRHGRRRPRLKQPLNLRLVRVPCTGRIDPLFALKAFEKGADGVLISGCHPGDCHYSEGNYYARRKFELLERMLHHLGIPKERFKWTWVSASEGAALAEGRHRLRGRREGARPARGEGSVSRQDHIRELRQGLPQPSGRGGLLHRLEVGLQQLRGHPGVRARTPADVDQLVWNPLCHHNLVTFLKRKMPDPTDAKIGVCVKGCDSRTLVALLQEELVDKDQLYVVGVPCDGIVDRRKLEKEFADEMVDIVFADGTVTATTRGGDSKAVRQGRRPAGPLPDLPLPQPALLRRHSPPTC